MPPFGGVVRILRTISIIEGGKHRIRYVKVAWDENIQPNGVEYTLDVQVHDLRKSGIRMRVELFSPCCASVREEYINMICCFPNFLDQGFHARNFGAIRWNRNRFCPRSFVTQSVQSSTGRIAGCGFTGSDVDL